MQKIRDNPNLRHRSRRRAQNLQDEGPRARLRRRRRREADDGGQARRDQPGVELHDEVRRQRVDGGELQHHAGGEALQQPEAGRPLRRRGPHADEGALRLRPLRRRKRGGEFPGAEGLRQLAGGGEVFVQVRREGVDR